MNKLFSINSKNDDIIRIHRLFDLKCERITDCDYKLLCLPDLDYWLTAGVTGQQGMLIPPKHLTSPLVYPVHHLSLILWVTLMNIHVLWHTSSTYMQDKLCQHAT